MQIVTGKTRRINTRRATKRIDFNTGIIGNRRLSAQCTGMARFDDGVFNETQPVFYCIGNMEVALRHQFEGGRYAAVQHCLQFK